MSLSKNTPATSNENFKKPILILICGGTGSGKSSLSKAIKQELETNNRKVVLLPTDDFLSDNFIKGKGEPPKPKGPLKERIKWVLANSHEPETTNLPQLTSCLKLLLQGRDAWYEMGKKRIKQEAKASDVIIVEGHRAFQHQQINEIADLKIYVDADDDLRLIRMIKRNPWYNEMIGKEIKDSRMFGENLPDSLEVWIESVKTPTKKYVLPTKKHADLVLFNNEQSDLEKNVQSITSLIDLYFQNQSEFKTQLEKSQIANDLENYPPKHEEKAISRTYIQESLWKQNSTYLIFAGGVGITCLGLGIYWLLSKKNKT